MRNGRRHFEISRLLCDTEIDGDPYQWDARNDCEVRQILDRIAGKWSLLTIALLDGGRRRFTELQRMIDGISQRMLSVTLRQLERDGLVAAPSIPWCRRGSTTS